MKPFNEKYIKELPPSFAGRGEVRGFYFQQVERTDKGYIYEVSHPAIKKPHYEVFRHKVNKRFGVVRYPTGKSFSKWAWTCMTLAEAIKKLEAISLP